MHNKYEIGNDITIELGTDTDITITQDANVRLKNVIIERVSIVLKPEELEKIYKLYKEQNA